MANPRKGGSLKTKRIDEHEDEVEIDPSLSQSSMEMNLAVEIGRTIRDRFELTRLIGEGGMGVVYAAYDNQTDRDCAIKLVRAECMADKKFMTRFGGSLRSPRSCGTPQPFACLSTAKLVTAARTWSWSCSQVRALPIV